MSQVIWDRLGRQPRGPQPSLSHERIVEAAIEIADAEGIEAVSMRRIAALIDSGTMSLYRYVANKEELIDLMVDRVYGEALPPATPSGDWRADLTAMARRTREMAHRHPWVIPFMLGRPALGPNALLQMERCMACLDHLGLHIDAMLDMTSTVSSFVIGVVQAELADQEARRRTGLTEQEWRARISPYVQRVIASGRYPHIERIVIEAEDFPDRDEVFERRLGFVLDGLAVRLP
jgi:AcrR family transcriptional regulator